MKEAPRAAFSFVGFTIPEFKLMGSKIPAIGNLSVGFEPEGEYNEKDGSFIISLNYTAFNRPIDSPTGKAIEEDHDSKFITAKMIAEFKFHDSPGVRDIPTYFYKNSIAIIYPYLRAFITNLTTQAGLKPLIMPVLNLSAIEKELIENTVVIPKTKPRAAVAKKAVKKRLSN